MEIGKETSRCGKEVTGLLHGLEKNGLTFLRREMQVFLVGYIIIEICEIFTVGDFPLSNKVRIVSPLNITTLGACLLE
jgi:hypothetical protein